ncbi:MAG: transcriptional regulator [Chloroflexota bacterium]|nr:MAG: transcriptional regulator [Chloroflexota bacterium]UCF27993.1 MAG: transcriptional regulator [Chloroflexota bacterium]
MNQSESSNQELQPITNIDPLIHAPTRLKIMAYLSIVESADFTFLMNQTGLTRGNLSVNLRKLEDAGYISIKKVFVDRIPRTLIRLTGEGRLAIQTYRENMQQVLNELLGDKE